MNEALRSLEGVLAIIGQPQRTYPTVEDLNHIRAGRHLKAAILRQHHHDLVQKAAPRIGVRVHHPLGVNVVARAAALDHVAGQRVRRAAEADDAQPVAKMCGYLFDCLGHVCQVAGAVGAQRCDVSGGPHRMMHHRPFAGLKLEVQAHRLQRQQQVGEDDGRIHAQLFGCGDGDLGGQLRLLADFHQRVMLANIAVLLHIAAGLAQKPHWRAVYRPAQAGADEAAAVRVVLRSCFGGEVGVGWLHTKIILAGVIRLKRAGIDKLRLRLGSLVRLVVVILHHARQVFVDFESFGHFVQNDQLIKSRVADRAKQLDCLPDRFLHTPIIAARMDSTTLLLRIRDKGFVAISLKLSVATVVPRHPDKNRPPV